MDWQPRNLKNDIVTLLPLLQEDFEQLYRVASDRLIWEQHPSSDRYQRPVFEAFFAEAMTSGTAFAIMDTLTGKMIGSTRYYDYSPSENSVAVGYTFLARDHWGGKYNAAVKQLMLDYAFHFVEKVIFHVGATNLRSQTAVLRLGAVKSKEFYTDGPTGQRLSYEFALNKDEWTRHRGTGSFTVSGNNDPGNEAT